MSDAVHSLGPRRDFRSSGGGSREIVQEQRRVQQEPEPMAQLTDWRAKDARRERQRLRRMALEEEAARARGEDPPPRGLLGWLGSLIAPEAPSPATGGEASGGEASGGAPDAARDGSND